MSAADAPLRPEQFERYRRHLSLPEFGWEGQRKLLDSRVLLIGAGGLGCPLAQYLAAAGVGHLGIVDDDVVEVSNLQRQVLYATADIGRPKLEVAVQRVADLNPDVEVTPHPVRLTAENALEILAPYDVVIDGTDNLPTRYLSNDACVRLGVPNVYGSIFRFEGQASVFDARSGPCYRCLFPEPPPPEAVPSCAEGGVLGVLPGVVAMIQATEAIKLLTGIGEPLIGRLLTYDALRMRFETFRLHKDPACPACGEAPRLGDLIDYEGFCGVDRSAGAGPMLASTRAAAVRERIERGEKLLLLDVREPDEIERACIEGSLRIPLGQLEARLHELTDWKDAPIVVHCHLGVRSARAGRLLAERGFARVENMDGGIEAWSLTVDPSVPRYQPGPMRNGGNRSS